MQDPDFAQAYQDRWQELRAGPFATANLHAIIDRQAAEITEPVAAANGTRNWTTRLQAMKDWLAARAEAIDELYVDAPRFDLERERALPGAPVHIFASAGTIYYAPDGTDPRRSGGEVAEHAIELPAGNSMETVLVEANARAAAIVPSAEFHDQHGMTWTSHTTNFDDSPNAGWKHGTMGIGFDENDTYLPLLGLDLSQEMSNVNGTFYARIPFTVDGDDSSFDFLQLRMRYDDGFIAYVNGTEVLRVNAPVNATWDSVATLANRDSDAVEFQRFDVTPFASVLRPGTNLLAIHGLNRRATDNDLLIQAELVGGKYGRATLTPGITPRVVARALLDGQWSAAAAIVVAQPGDANGDGVFDSADLVQVFQAGRYEASPAQPVTFAEGDWNLDGRFSSRDLVMAFQAGSFQLVPASGSKRFAIDAVLDIAIETITSEVDAARHLRQA
jgi:hypothetical protein